MRRITGVASAFVMFALLTAPAGAHEAQTVGNLRLSVGWAEEPTYAGLPNAMELSVTDTAGAPVTDASATLTVEITFGSAKMSRTMAPAGPGRYAASVTPTRAGTYAVRVHGTVRGTNIDITSTCSDRTFDCVKNGGDLEFPAKDPSTGDLAARLQRETDRIDKKASETHPLTYVALALAAAALALAAVGTARGARKH